MSERIEPVEWEWVGIRGVDNGFECANPCSFSGSVANFIILAFSCFFFVQSAERLRAQSVYMCRAAAHIQRLENKALGGGGVHFRDLFLRW